MNKIATIAGLAVAATTMATSADILLSVDLLTTNQVTITATGGLSSGTVSGSSFTGFLLADFFGSATDLTSLIGTPGAGDIRAAGDSSDGTPDLFRAGGGTDSGLNIWSYATADSNWVAGSTAFAGSATWDLSAAAYADMVSGAGAGDIYAPADDSTDISGATFLGTYEFKTVPAPSAMALLGLGGLVAGRRRR